MKKEGLKADGMILLAAAIWGSGFVAQRLGMQHVGPHTFNAIRFSLGIIILVPLMRVVARRARQRSGSNNFSRSVFVRGALSVGMVMFVAAAMQQVAMVHTTAGKGGFITGLYVVFVPVLGLFLGHRVGISVWIAVVFAAGGMYLLSAAESSPVNCGDLIMLASAVLWAVHVLAIGFLAPRCEALKLAVMQFAVVSVCSTVAAIATEEIAVESIRQAGWAILYSGCFPIATACTLQVLAQRKAPAAHVAILLSLESVFAAVFGRLILDELLTSRQLVGCTLILVGMLVAQLRRSSSSFASSSRQGGKS